MQQISKWILNLFEHALSSLITKDNGFEYLPPYGPIYAADFIQIRYQIQIDLITES